MPFCDALPDAAYVLESEGSQVYDGTGRPGDLRMTSAFRAFCTLHLCRSSNMSARAAKRQMWHLRRRLKCFDAAMWDFMAFLRSGLAACWHASSLHIVPLAFKMVYLRWSQCATSSAGMAGIGLPFQVGGALTQSMQCTQYSFSPIAGFVPSFFGVKNSTNSWGGGLGASAGRSYGVGLLRCFAGNLFVFLVGVGQKGTTSESESDEELDPEEEAEELEL